MGENFRTVPAKIGVQKRIQEVPPRNSQQNQHDRRRLWPLALQTADWEAVLHPLAADNEDSKATVREALQHLEHSGLVTRRENVGSLVTGLSPKDIRERLTLRVTLEVMAAHFRASTVPQDRSIRRTFRRELWARTAETDEGEQQS